MPTKFLPFLKEKLKNPQSWKREGDMGPGGGSRTTWFFNPVISTKNFVQSRNLTRAHTFNPESSPILLLNP